MIKEKFLQFRSKSSTSVTDKLLPMFIQAKMKSLLEDWRNLFSHQKQVG